MYSLVVFERFHRSEALSAKFAEILGVAVHIHVLPKASAVLAELAARLAPKPGIRLVLAVHVPLHGVLVREHHVAAFALDVLRVALVNPGDVLLKVVVGREELAAYRALEIALRRYSLLPQVGQFMPENKTSVFLLRFKDWHGRYTKS